MNAADLVTFTEEILNGKLHFFCSVISPSKYWNVARLSWENQGFVYLLSKKRQAICGSAYTTIIRNKVMILIIVQKLITVQERFDSRQDPQSLKIKPITYLPIEVNKAARDQVVNLIHALKGVSLESQLFYNCLCKTNAT